MRSTPMGSRRRWIAFGQVLILCSLGAQGQSRAAKAQPDRASAMSQQIAAERQAALAAYDAGNTKEALPTLQAIAGKLPRDFAVQEALGLSLAETGAMESGEHHLGIAAALQPENAAARLNHGAALLRMQHVHQAAEEFAVAARLDPDNAETQAALGRALFLDGHADAAAASLGRASRSLPDDASVRYDWVLALDATHQDATALTVLDDMPAAQRTAAVESLWGDVAEHAGQYMVAAEHLKRAAELEPSEPNVYALTVEFLRHWTWQSAEQFADYGLARYPESQRLRFAKGVALYGNAQFVAAADWFAPMLQAHPDNSTYADLLGRSCAALGGSVSANCDTLAAFAAQHPDNARAALYAAISMLHGGNSEAHLPQAETLLRSSLAHDPRNSEAWYELGVLEQQRGEWAESATSLQKAIQLRPSYAEAHYRLSRAYAHQGQKDVALQELALQKQFAAQDKQTADAQLKEVTIFLTDAK